MNATSAELVPTNVLPAEPVTGSLFSGFGGLERGVQAVLGGTVAWHCENDPAASKVLAHNYPGVPNLGDITAVDWTAVEPVDVLTGGFPCQDVSLAGARGGMTEGTRSGLWAHMVTAIGALRPRLVVIENVRGLLTARGAPPTPELLAAWAEEDRCARILTLLDSKLDRALKEGASFHARQHAIDRDRFVVRRKRAVVAVKRADARIVRAIGAVLGTLAGLGYDAQWCGLPASGVGASHERFRVFIFAWPAADAADVGHERGRSARGRRGGSEDRRVDAADTHGAGPQGTEPTAGHHLPTRGAAPDADRDPVREQPITVARDCGEAVVGLTGTDVATDTEGTERRGQEPDDLGTPGTRTAELGERPGSPTDTESVGRGEGRTGSAGIVGRPDVAVGGGVDWGRYGPAIRRWETVLGRRAPAPTIRGTRGQPKLNPAFVEFLMGLPEGHVTAVPGLTVNDKLRVLGNGVVPQQCEAALRWLLNTTEQSSAA